MKPTDKKRITYHVKNRQSAEAHDFATRRAAISFGRELARFFGPGPATFVIAQERNDNGEPAAAPEVIWARQVRS